MQNYQKYVGKEIGGTYFAKDGSATTTHMTMGNYKNNTLTQNTGRGMTAGFREGLNPNELTGFYHTHLDIDGDVSRRTKPSPKDKETRDQAKALMPNLEFFIITSPLYNGAENEKNNYTNDPL